MKLPREGILKWSTMYDEIHTVRAWSIHSSQVVDYDEIHTVVNSFSSGQL
jgi:hypothetical protein